MDKKQLKMNRHKCTKIPHAKQKKSGKQCKRLLLNGSERLRLVYRIELKDLESFSG